MRPGRRSVTVVLGLYAGCSGVGGAGIGAEDEYRHRPRHPDAALPDAALPDAALPGAAVHDAATPDAAAAGAFLYVSPAGSDANPGTIAAPFATLQRAANVVSPGDVVLAAAGVYSTAASGLGSKLVILTRGGTADRPV